VTSAHDDDRGIWQTYNPLMAPNPTPALASSAAFILLVNPAWPTPDRHQRTGRDAKPEGLSDWRRRNPHVHPSRFAAAMMPSRPATPTTPPATTPPA
jgi:hypothetical protein